MRLLLLPILLSLTACATPHVVDIVQPNDEQLNCAGLQNEVDELDQFIEEAESEKENKYLERQKRVYSSVKSAYTKNSQVAA